LCPEGVHVNLFTGKEIAAGEKIALKKWDVVILEEK
jgi:hypothetical protein